MNISYPMKTRPFAGMTMVALLMCLTACTAVDEQAKQQAAIRKVRQETAMRMWKERCETKAGEKIYKTVDNVDGIFLMKIRPEGIPNYGDQFRMDDPYGRDVIGDGYVRSFLKGGDDDRRGITEDLTHLPNGYLYVEAVDTKDNQRYRYTGKISIVGEMDKSAAAVRAELLNNPNYDTRIFSFVINRKLSESPMPRYGITYDDISTSEEREYWIAGSSLRVVDLHTNEVIAERIGYMVDWAQGSLAGARSPWLFAADNACPYFAQRHGALAQLGQTARFVEKVLKPSK